ncbi:MAG: cysteine--tRNA ligase [Minisyncoccota bacterium]
MVLNLYNTLSRKKEPFHPLINGRVSMYSCGPTVYDYAHVGNLRAFLVNDILRRTLSYVGYDVTHVMNITDIDDKMIKKGVEEKMSLADIAQRYEGALLKDFGQLTISTPHRLPHATQHINGMIALIEKLLSNGCAYIAEDGVYFSIAKSSEYGALAHITLTADTRSRIVADDYDKNNVRDFALWKFWTQDDGENFFEAPFGRGRPGWHIECSAMAMSELGETIDIHTGGVDLIFPHHTNEIAQSEAVTRKQFVRQWIHIEFVMVDGQKMSKSLHNIITLNDIVEHGLSPLAFRYWVLGAHYRTKANFTWEGLAGAHTALEKIFAHMRTYENHGKVHAEYQKRFLEYVCDDLDTPKGVALLWGLIKDANVSGADKKATLLDFDAILGLGLANIPKSTIPENIVLLVQKREDARTIEDWGRADTIRQEVLDLGYEIEDGSTGPRIVPKTRP